jgi:ubiquinone/menaquinone biosynthesis C-methylase UbiE
MDDENGTQGFLPAAGRAPLALYDSAIAFGTRERTFRGRLQAQVLDGGGELEILDVGCGTGTLAITLAGGGARVTAVDPDPRALARAQTKRGAPAVRWLQGYADAARHMPPASVDRVVFSLVLHHLQDEAKRVALIHAQRILRPGGRVHIAEWGVPGDPLMAIAFRALQAIDGAGTTASMGRGELPAMLHDAGFASVVEHDRLRTAFGRLVLTSAERP